MATNTPTPNMQAITTAAQKAITASGLAVQLPRSLAANPTLQANLKKAAGNQAAHNLQHWQGIQQVLQANGGKATAQELLAGAVAGAPYNVGNAAKYLGYAVRNGWLVVV